MYVMYSILVYTLLYLSIHDTNKNQYSSTVKTTCIVQHFGLQRIDSFPSVEVNHLIQSLITSRKRENHLYLRAADTTQHASM